MERHCQRKGLPCQFAYFERRNRRGQVVHRWYLVTSQTEWDLLSLWHAWQARWAIEGLHRDGKQHLRLSDFHARTWEGIVAWLACTTLRLSLLCFLRAVAPAYRALSLQAVVTTLRQAACLIEHVPASAPAGEPGQDAIWVHRPPTLPASSLWSAEPLPLLPPEVLLDRRVA